MNTRPLQPRRQPRLQRRQAGVTLVETATVTALMAVLTGLAAPAFDQSIQRRHLEGAAARVHVGGEAWTVLKPWLHQKHYRASRSADWRQLAAVYLGGE